MAKKTSGVGALVRSVLVLLSGQSLAQVIAFAISPVLTRLYSPEDFGLLREVTAWSGVFVGIAALRYDMAVPLPRGERTAASLVRLSEFVVLGIVAAAVLCAAIGSLAGLANFPNFLWALAVGAVVWFTGTFNVARWWSIRQGRFSAIARASVFGALVSAGVKSGAGVLFANGPALVTGHLVGLSAAWLWIHGTMRRDNVLNDYDRHKPSWARKFVAACYREFPSYHAPLTLANNFGQQLPVFVIAAIFSQSTVGQWALATMVGKMPIQMLVMSVSQVFVKRASERVRARQSVLPDLSMVTALMVAFAAVYALGVWFLAEPLVPVLFGEQWNTAARFLKLMLPWTVMIIVSSPSIGLIAPLRLQRGMLTLQAVNIVVVLLGAWLIDFSGSPDELIVFFSATMAVTSAAMMVLAFVKASRRSASTPTS